MSDTLYEDLWWCWQNRKFKESPYVFVSDRPQHYGLPFTSRRRFIKGMCKRAGVKEFGFHALRRYVASVLADTHKVSAKTIQRILRHKNLSTTERYIHNINQDLHAVVNLLSTNGPHMAPMKRDPGSLSFPITSQNFGGVALSIRTAKTAAARPSGTNYLSAVHFPQPTG